MPATLLGSTLNTWKRRAYLGYVLNVQAAHSGVARIQTVDIGLNFYQAISTLPSNKRGRI